MKRKLIRSICLTALAATVSACVTINIYFPAAAAEKAADKIIDDVWQIKDGTQPPVDKPTDGSAKPAETSTK